MKSAWKGLVVGGLTGGVLGLVMDALSRAGKKAVEIKDLAEQRAPEAAHHFPPPSPSLPPSSDSSLSRRRPWPRPTTPASTTARARARCRLSQAR